VVDLEAYALWLKGRYVYSKWGKENFESAIEAFKAALEIEPDYVAAWASLSIAYLTQTQSGYLEAAQGIALSRAAIEKALSIDPDRPSVLARLANVQNQFDWDFAAAEATIEKALAIDPMDSRVLGAAGTIAGIYAWHGGKDAAFDWLEQAYQQHSGLLSQILKDPLLVSLKDDPRWKDLTDHMGLPN
jgi:tetratricopeptide (TPR) repeat protein